MNQCPCCSQLLVRCIRKDGVYWFCSSCWQEMPDLASLVQTQAKIKKDQPASLVTEQ